MRKLLDVVSVRFNNTGLENPIEYLKSLNPMQIVKPQIPINVFKVDYTYTTTRGNKKEGVKYFMVNSINPQQNCGLLLSSWVNEHNSKNKHRQLSNVKFLDSSLLMSLTI